MLNLQPVTIGTKPGTPTSPKPTTQTTRAAFGTSLCGAMHATADQMRVAVIVAWCMMEGQEARENDPLAAWNANYGKPPSLASDKFAYDTIGHAIVDSAKRMESGQVYGSIGDAFRNGSATAQSIITAIQNAGWCGGPKAPCIGYGAGITSNYNRITKDAASWTSASGVICGTTGIDAQLVGTITGPGFQIGGPGIPNINVPNPIGTVDDAVKALGTLANLFSTLVGNLTTVAFWKRAGVFVAGLVALFVGLFIVFRDSKPVGAVKSAAKGVTEAATAAAVL